MSGPGYGDVTVADQLISVVNRLSPKERSLALERMKAAERAKKNKVQLAKKK